MSETYDVTQPSVNVPPVGEGIPRIESRLKVTGTAPYAADEPMAGTLHGVLVTTPVTRGRVRSIDAAATEAVPGVRLVLTHANMPKLAALTPFTAGGTAHAKFDPLADATIRYAGQIVALVVAETIEAAGEGARRLAVETSPEDGAHASLHAPNAPSANEVPEKIYERPETGDIEAALASAAATIEAEYLTPVQHHNPIELFFTGAEWRGDRLTVYVPSQWMTGSRAALATAFSLPAEKVRVVSRYVGGGFGSKGLVMAHTLLTAAAARMLGAPVKLYVGRDQGFTVASFRPATRQRVRLGANADGSLVALDHEQTGQTSSFETYFLPGTEITTRLYAWDAARGSERTVALDTNTPGFMRAPAETPSLFALECAIDELAHETGADPVRMRTLSDGPNEPIEGKPWSSRSLVQCLERGADRFGWSDRDPVPGSMTRDGMLVGWGCASATYPVYTAPGTAEIRLGSDLSCRIAAAGHEIGVGLMTVLQQICHAELGVPLERIVVEVGDSDLPANAIAGGSRQTASIGSAALDACRSLRAQLVGLAVGAGGPLEGADDTELAFVDGRVRAPDGDAPLGDVVARAPFGIAEARGFWSPASVTPKSVRELYRSGAGGASGLVTDDFARASFGAQFAEVLVDPLTFEIRVPRLVGAFACGRIMNERTARSQLMGGMIWGIGCALLEATEVDPRHARYVNTDLAEYAVAVNADAPSIEVELVEELDEHVNPLGTKAVGELGNVGVNAAIANAVFHATGTRVREFPIRMEHLLGA